MGDITNYAERTVAMGRRINERFLSTFIELDRDCCERFGVATGGVTEYINRLNNARFAPGRDEVLPKLVRYRNIRNKLAHETGSLRRMNDVSKIDIKWIRQFNRAIHRKKDPISAYLRKARRFARRRKAIRYGTFGAVILLLLLVIVILINALPK